MLSLIALSFLSLLALAQDPPSELGNVETFSNLSSYLFTRTQGAVKPVRESFLTFKIDHKFKEAVPVLPEANPDLIHSLFETDVEKMIQNEGVQDFVTAKKKFYGDLSFNRSTQQFARPYIYPSDWHSLNHNPIRNFNLALETYGHQFRLLDSKTIAKSPLVSVELHRKLDDVTGTEMTAGNKLRQLNNGEISFKEKVRMVKESKKFFHAIVMVQYCDESSSEIVDAMIERARAGVDVRLMMESVWSRLILQKCVKKLTDGGVKVTLGKGFFNPRTMFTVHHTKFWIRDGEEAIMGGQNTHDFENTSNGFNHHTRDKDVHVMGPAVTDMMREYVRIWNHEQKKPDTSMSQYLGVVAKKEAEERTKNLRGKDLYGRWLNTPTVEEIPGVCRVLVQGSKTTDTPYIITKAYLEIMKNTKYSMFINTLAFRFKEGDTNAYTNTQLIKEIIESSKRGTQIDLISNGFDAGWGEAGFQMRELSKKLRRSGKTGLAMLLESMNRVIAMFTSRTQFNNLANALGGTDVDVWLYFNHIHSKQMRFDHIMTSTGSFNLDNHSFKNHESTMICLDKKLADESLVSFLSDIVNSTPAF